MPIKFGTSGWRAIIADEFTFNNARLVVQAVCSYLKSAEETGKPVVIGYDARFMGENFAKLAAEVVSSNGFDVLICQEPTPTPAISHAIRSEKAAGGLNFTASHNPAQYQGIKFSTADGAPALPEITRQVESFIAEYQQNGLPEMSGTQGQINPYEPKESYFADIEKKIRFDVIAKSGHKYAFDPLWAAGRGYLDEMLRRHDIPVTTIHDWRDVTFGGRAPEPESHFLDDLRAAMLDNGCFLGLATDGDADRFGIVDREGEFILPNQLIAILTDYLIESRGWREGVGRSVATSHLVDRVAALHGIEVYETPVGFKYIGEMIIKDAIILGGEESAGMSIKGHYPEKDGILACLLAAEACAARKKTLSQQLEDIYSRVGRLESGRIGVRLTPEIAAVLPEKLRQEPTIIGSRQVEKINRADGVKIIFTDGSWLLLRPSGTEPLVRVYAETNSASDLEVLLEQGRQYLLGG